MSMQRTRKAPKKRAPVNTLNIENISIRTDILFDARLTAKERILHGILSHLTSKSPDNYTYATNIELAEVLGVDPQIVSNAIARFRKFGLITVEYKRPLTDGTYIFQEYNGEGSWSYIRRIRMGG